MFSIAYLNYSITSNRILTVDIIASLKGNFNHKWKHHSHSVGAIQNSPGAFICFATYM